MADSRTAAMLAVASGDGSPTATDPRTAAMLAAAQPSKASSKEWEDEENPINAAVGGFVRQTAASVGAAAAAGVRGLYDIASGRGFDKAAQDIKETAGNSLGYRTRSAAEAAGAQASQSGGNPLNWIPNTLSWAGDKLGGAAESMGAPPAVSAALNVAPTAAATVFGGPIARGTGAVVRAVKGLKPYEVAAETAAPTAQAAQAVVDKTAQNSPQSQGAAAASSRLSNASPQLQQAIVSAAQRTGGAINPDALSRHVEADTLPVPIRLTEGEALADVTKISNERNSAALADFYNKRNGQLKQNLQALRDEVGPDVFTTNAVEHGDTLIKAYEDKGKAREDSIAADYQALRDANGGKFPVDAKKLASNVTDQLHQDLLYEHAPVQLKQLLALADKGGMTFEQFEAMRTTLARTMRSSTDGNERAAAGVIRQQMENLPLSGETATLKPLADKARANARGYYAELEADPAYKAAINGTVAPDRFVQKFVTGGTRNNVALMRQNLADNPPALQTMGVATIDSLRDAAGVKPDGSGTFSEAGFNKQRLALDPKMRSLVEPAHAETLEQLGNVARYTQEQPAGHHINNSKTFVAAAAEHGAGLVEGLANAKAGGLPVGTMGRNFLNKRAQKAAMKRITAPGAGLDVLEEKP